MKILIMHSDKMVANAISDGLTEAQYEVHYTADGEAGLDIAMKGQFDLIILDSMLQKRDGLTVLRKLRQYKNLVPVLMVTSDDSVMDLVKSLDSGANDCVTVPFDLYVLIARMKALIRRSKWDLCAEVGHDSILFDSAS
jgi:DNA-binding response OmpR family regulator